MHGSNDENDNNNNDHTVYTTFDKTANALSVSGKLVISLAK